MSARTVSSGGSPVGDGIFSVCQTTDSEKQQGTMEHLLVSPANRVALYFGRGLIPILISLITVSVALTYAVVIFHAPIASGALLPLAVSIVLSAFAMVGFGLLLTAGISSIKRARRRLKYETWWVIHLYMYLALALAFAHQIVTGGAFVGHPLTRAIWIAVWILTAGMVIAFRIGQPVVRSLWHGLRVVAVREEVPGVYLVLDVRTPERRVRHLARMARAEG